MFRRGGKLSILSVKDDRIKVMNERLNMTEKHFMELYAYFASCTRKLAKFRNAYDELARAVKCYAEEEDINDSLSLGLKSFTNSITILADYMDIEIHRMEAKIFNEFLQFENICKTSKENLRLAVVARDKEVLRQKQMIEIKTKFSANTSAADSELVKAKMEVNRTNKEIDEIINTFEKRKMQDIKRILNDFVLISMKYHTKALEVLTATHYDISNIDEELDLKEFQKLMKTDDEPVKPTSIRKTLRAAHSMDDLDKRASPLNSIAKLTGSARNISFEAQSGNEEDEESETDTGEDEVSNSESEDSGSDDDVTQNSIHEIEEKTHIPSFRAKKPPTSIGIPKEPVPLSRMVTVSETAIELPTAAPRQPIDCTVRKK